MFWDKKLNINNNEIHVVDWPGSGDTVVCIHGITGNAHWWDKIAGELSPSYRVLAYDLPGRGDSAIPRAPHGYEEHVQDILALLNSFDPAGIILLGHSFGASIACYLAATQGYLVKKMVLIDGGADQTPKARQALALTLNTLEHVFGSFAECTQFTRKTLFKDDWSPYAERLYYHDVIHHPDGTVTFKAHKDYIL
ncbi:MAG: alpha/beta hydrolase, partial [Peptococcaceae bacterium]|nr:alpha/beta hydrolase [Peptococcaceae bacterium]